MEIATELTLERLVIEDDRPAHIARHGVTVDDALAVLIGEFVAVPGKESRYVVIGRDEQERFLAIIIGARTEEGTFGLVTARPARRTERALYSSMIKGGEGHD